MQLVLHQLLSGDSSLKPLGQGNSSRGDEDGPGVGLLSRNLWPAGPAPQISSRVRVVHQVNAYIVGPRETWQRRRRVHPHLLTGPGCGKEGVNDDNLGVIIPY